MDDLRLKDISIKNFRSIKDLKFELSPEITLLVGPNGAGKSNILRAMAILYTKIKYNDSDYSLLLKIASSKQESFLIKATTISAIIDFDPINQAKFKDLDPLMQAILPDPKELTKMAFYMEGMRQYEQQSMINTMPILMSPDGRDLAGAFHYYFSSAEAQPDELGYYIKKVQRIIPEIQRISAPNISGAVHNAAFKLEMGKGNNILNIGRESATPGTLDAIFISFILQIMPKFSVYLLDSPDINLHEGAQEELIQLIRETAKKESKQFIIATHSPVLINACSPEEVILVTKENAQTKVKKVSKVSEIMDVLQSTDTKLSDIASSMKAV